MPGLTLVTAPAVEPLTLTQALQFMRVDTTEEQESVGTMIQAAREWVEQITGRQLITATWRLDLDDFPAADSIDLPRPPLGAVSSITYYDASNAQQTLSAATVYEVDASPHLPRVRLRSTGTWPTVYDRANAVSVNYTAGYGSTPATVPAPIRMAMLQLVSHWFENREATVIGPVSSEVALAAKRLLQPYRLELLAV